MDAVELESRGISFSANGPDGLMQLSAAEANAFAQDRTKFMCELYQCTIEELKDFYEYGQGCGSHSVRCFSKTKKGRRCKNYIPERTTDFGQWLDLLRQNGYCTIHREK